MLITTKKDPPQGEPLIKRETRSFKNGAENRIRTDDLRITNALLYQLSYLGAFPVTMGILTDPGVAGNFRIYQLCQFLWQSWGEVRATWTGALQGPISANPFSSAVPSASLGEGQGLGVYLRKVVTTLTTMTTTRIATIHHLSRTLSRIVSSSGVISARNFIPRSNRLPCLQSRLRQDA